MNQFGRLFRVHCFGSSHGPFIGAMIDAPKPGLDLCVADFDQALRRRRGGVLGTTSRVESDQPNLISGWVDGKTTGAPLTLLFENQHQRSGDYQPLEAFYRPGHADWTAQVKYQGYQEKAGGGIFSGRMTLALVAAGVVAKKQLLPQIRIHARMVEVGGVSVENEHDPQIEAMMLACRKAGDAVGGIVECCCEGVPAGWGEPFFDSVESLIAHAVFSIPGVRGVEFGDGFSAARMKASQHNDRYVGPNGQTDKNGAGGINGGITNGNPLVFRVAFKPTNSIEMIQSTWNHETQEMAPLQIKGRHDTCFALRTPVVVESVAAMVLADLQLLSGCGNTCSR